jgi:predicted GIY-YIG superfamily endonuclease
MEKGTKVYIYCLIDSNNNVFYIGKSSRPKGRFYDHVSHLGRHDITMKILDFFFDKEIYWMEKLLKDGHPIQNKEILSTMEQWEVGETFNITRKIPAKVKYNGKIYNSLNALYKSRDLNLSEYHLKKIIENPECALAKQYPIALI